MFEEKTYLWLLHELFRAKTKLKILDIAFCKADSVENVFFTDNEGSVNILANKHFSVRDALKTFLSKRISGLENKNSPKPIVYVTYCLSKKVLFYSEIQEILRKDLKQTNLKEIVLFQEYCHDYSTFYTLELTFDGEGLASSLSRRDTTNLEFFAHDLKYLHIAIHLSNHLVKVIENTLNKNIIRLKFDFVIDLEFNPIILNVLQIKIAHPKVLALNKNLNADQLESLTLFKNEYKAAQFLKVDFAIKEPETNLSISGIEDSISNKSIFVSFVSKFLSGDSKKLLKSKSIKPGLQPLVQTSKYVDNEGKQLLSFEVPNIPNRLNRNVISPDPTLQIHSPNSAFSYQLKRVPSVMNKRKIFNEKILFPNLKPSASFTKFLKAEETRILEKNSKNVDFLKNQVELPAIKISTKKKKKGKKAKKKEKGNKEILISPYCK